MQHRLILALLVLAAFSCNKPDAKLTLDKTSSFPGGALTASSSSVTLSNSNDADTVLTFSWPAVNYGQEVSVTYTVQLDVASDTAGTTPWGLAKSFGAGANILTYGWAGKDLNNLASTMGLTPGSSNPVVVRIASQVTQYNGSTSTIPTVYSNTITVDVTPYGLDLYVPGAYQNWLPASAPVIAPVSGRAGLYEGYVDITGSGLQYFKYTNAPDWNHINYGDGGNGTFSTDGAAAGLSVPNGGYYELTANLNNNTWTATATTWGIIGDATPGGWNTDSPMTYDAANQVWTITVPMIAAGSFKFRANDQWVIDFGIDAGGNLQYADNPFLGYTAGLNNLTVSADGTYTIILDLHVSGKYTYQLNKH
jgi:starch-binding outer membrane protein SusE/F